MCKLFGATIEGGVIKFLAKRVIKIFDNGVL